VKAGSSRRDFICRGLFGAAITGLLSRVASTSAKTESRWVDRRQLGRIGTDVSILGLGLGAAFMDGYERNLDAGHALLESALALGINWDTARVTVPAKEWLLPVLSRNRFDPDAVLTIFPCTRPDKGRLRRRAATAGTGAKDGSDRNEDESDTRVRRTCTVTR
jgi:hypothetical protein